MEDKLVLYILLAGLFYLPTILPEEISNETKEKALQKFFTEHYEECKHTISEEIYQILLDTLDPDNEETRAFSTCCFKAYKWMVNMKIDTDTILTAIPHFIERELTSSESVATKSIVKSCKRQAESTYFSEVEVAIYFSRCYIDQFQSDI